MRFEDKVALVTGSSRGIGRATALRFGSEGAAVVVNYVKEVERARQVADIIERSGGRSLVVKADVSQKGQVDEMVGHAFKAFGKIDILVNNAGITMDRTLRNMSCDEWNRVVDVNLNGAFNCTRACIDQMISNRYGRVVNVSSIAAIVGNFGQSNYSASKGALLSFTKSLAREVAGKGITVNAVAPGFVNTEMLRKVPPKVLDGILSRIPMRRFARPEEICNAILFLASDDASYVTGSVLIVDGGYRL